MLNNKSAVNLCVLMLLTLALCGPVVSAQSNELERKLELGVQISGLAGGPSADRGTVGGGGRVTYNLTNFFALEGELNYLSSNKSDNFNKFQGQFGVKSGWRFNKFGLFGKVRPGFITTRQDVTAFIPIPCAPATGTVCIQSIIPIFFSDSYTGFSLDVGGVAELYPSKRIVVRFDVGDTIHNRRSVSFINIPTISTGQQPPIFGSGIVVPAPGFVTTNHYLQLSVGVGFRL